ncbi:MAG: KAP family NTPase [Ruminococcus sp.]|nr:KAP family NTPase [Ruminococcus sp.]
MNRAEMNKFIADYLQNDKTTFAMMLSGEWGTGKSFYIKGELSKEIKDNGNELMVISLYGMSNLQELSQRICYERFHTSLNAVKAIEVTAKTIINYSPLPQIFWTGVGKVADKIKEKIDKSIDLTGILLVLEDVERTKIDLEDFFGYVNNLCEQDGVKVLLVTDEEKVREKLDNYDKIKDKVVGDTIHFEPDLEATLRNIFDIYGFDDVCDLDADMSDIRTILYDRPNDRPNFRKVIYACQKVHEIFNCEEFADYKDDAKYKQFRKNIFLSTLLNVHKGFGVYFFPNGDATDSKNEKEDQSIVKSLQNNEYEDYPLPSFVYNYLIYQKLDKDEISRDEKEYANYLKFEKENIIHEFEIVKNSRNYKEEEIKRALEKTSEYMEDKNRLFYLPAWLSLAEGLGFINSELEIDTENCMKKLEERFTYEAEIIPDIESQKSMRKINLSKDETIQSYIAQIRKVLFKPKKSLYEECNGDIKSFINKWVKNSSPHELDIFIENVTSKEMAEFMSKLEDDVDTAKKIYELITLYPIHKNKKWFDELKNELSDVVENYTADKVVKYHLKHCMETIKVRINTPEKSPYIQDNTSNLIE